MAEFDLPLRELNQRTPVLSYLVKTLWECAGASEFVADDNWKLRVFENASPFERFDLVINKAFNICVERGKKQSSLINPIIISDIVFYLQDIFSGASPFANFDSSKWQSKLERIGAEAWMIVQKDPRIAKSIHDSKKGYLDRMLLWTDDKLSDAERRSFAEDTFGTYTDFPLQANAWRKRRDWVYSQALKLGSAGSKETAKTETPMDQEIRYVLDIDRAIAGLLAAKQIRLSLNQNRYSYKGDIDSIIQEILQNHKRSETIKHAIERSLERLYGIAPQAFGKLDLRNPGLILANRLILTEATRAEIERQGLLKTWKRESAKAHHPDVVDEKSAEMMKRSAMAIDVLSSPENFRLWKEGIITFKFE